MLVYPAISGGVSAGNPPVFVAQNADDDECDPQKTLEYFSELLAAKLPSPTLHMYPKGGHGFGICQDFHHQWSRRFQECCEWPLHALRFMQDNGFLPGFPLDPSYDSTPSGRIIDI